MNVTNVFKTRELLRKAAAVLLPLLFSGCLYSKVVFPLDQDVNQTELGSKIGRSSSHSVCWLAAWGDSGTKAAAENGGISVIRHLDVERYMILFGAYLRVTTIAYGD
jgi:hypothetical protein